MSRHRKQTNDISTEAEPGNDREDDNLDLEDPLFADDTSGQGDRAREALDDDDENPEGWSRGEESFEDNAMEVDAAGGELERPRKKK